MASGDTLSLYVEHRDELLNYANRIVRDRACAEDLVQEAWLKYTARARQGAEIAQPLNYLYSIVRNLALDWLRHASRTATQAISDSVLETVASNAPSAEQVVYYRDELRALEAIVSELPERTQIAFRMYRVERRTLQEVADRLGVSVVRVHKMVKDAVLHCTLRLSGPEDR